jgi:hypothetical protein
MARRKSARSSACSVALMLAHGLTIEQLVDLVRAELATAMAQRVVAAALKFEVATLRINRGGTAGTSR